MTEPDQPGSDPYSIQTQAVRDGDEWVINGHKWFTSGANRSSFAIVMCCTEVDDEKGLREKMTQIIVPTDTPGFNIVRSVPVWGHDGDHYEIKYENVRVPITNQLGQTGSGHQAARLMTIHCAGKIDSDLDAKADISAIKVFVPAAMDRVVDRAIQVYGAKGVSSDTPLESMYRGARTLRILDAQMKFIE